MDTKKLRQKILDLAIHGKLVPQDPNDEPASVLLERIRSEKEHLIKEGKIKRSKKTASDTPNDKIVPFELPAGWCWCRLDEIAFVTKLAGFEYTNYIAENLSKTEGIPLFKGKNVQDGEIIYEFESFIPIEVSDSLQRSQITKKCLLTPYVGTIGNIGIHNKKGIYHLGSNVGKIELFNDIDLNVYEEYIRFYLMSSIGYKELIKHKKATAQDSISIDAIRDVYIALPPIQEQRRIIDQINRWLSFVHDVDNNRNAIIDLLELSKSKILDLAIHGKLVPQDPNDEPAIELLKRINPKFEPCDTELYPYIIPDSWQWVMLSDISEDSADGPFGSNLKKEHYTNKKEVRIIQLSNIGEEGWRDENVKYTTKQHLETISRSEVHPGDIVIAKMMPAGRAILCPNDDEKYVLSSAAVKFQIPKDIDNKFLLYAINSSVFRKQVYDNVQGVTRVRTSLQKLRKYQIPLPPILEQHRIVEKIEELFSVLDSIKESLE